MSDGNFGNWYGRNKERLAERRKRRYREDPEYREKILAHKRAKGREERAAIAPYVRKVVGKKEILLLRIGDAAERVGVTAMTLRDWEERGLIPKSAFPWKHRYYTDHQVDLLSQFVSNKDADVESASANVFATWNKGVPKCR